MIVIVKGQAENVDKPVKEEKASKSKKKNEGEKSDK